VQIVEKIGVAAIDITSGSNQETLEWTVPLGFMPSGLNADITAAIKKSGIKIPVSVTGKIGEPALAEEILRDGKADFVCIGRGFDRRSLLAGEGQRGAIRRYPALYL